MCGSIIALLFVACAAVPYVVGERRWRWRWREVEVGRAPAVDEGGAYRDGGDVPRFATRAPASVRAVAFTSLLLGQLFVPILCAGALTLLVFGLGLLAIPTLVAAAKLYRAGLSLLRRDPRLAYFRARDAATWVAWVSGVTLFVAGAMLTRMSWRDLHTIVGAPLVVVGVLALAGLAQSVALRRVTRTSVEALFAASRQPTIVL